MSIAEWPQEERPREKLLARGAAALSDAELLAIFLRTGLPGLSAVDMARELVADFGSLSALFSANVQDFSARRGLGLAKYAQFMAVKELARRVLAEQLQAPDALSSPDAVRDYLRWTIGRRDIEVFVVLFLTAQNRVIAVEEVAQGSVSETRVYPREIVRRALWHNASAAIIAHNHPGGCAEASAADRALTATLRAALELVEVRLLDHFIVTASATESFAERGWL